MKMEKEVETQKMAGDNNGGSVEMVHWVWRNRNGTMGKAVVKTQENRYSGSKYTAQIWYNGNSCGRGAG